MLKLVKHVNHVKHATRAMRVKQLRLRALLLLAAPFVVVLFASDAARAKGSLSAGGGAADVITSDDAVVRTVTDGRQRAVCSTPPTAQQCEDPSYPWTTCGARWADRIRAGEVTSCQTSCGAPDLVDCESAQFHLSLCGVVDARARAVSGPAPDAANNDCALAPGTCAQVLCEELVSGGGSILGAAPEGPVVVPTSFDPDTGNSTRDRLSFEMNGFGATDNIAVVPLLEDGRNTFRADGTGVHYWSRMQRDQVRFIGDFPSFTPVEILNARAAFAADREAWEANGNTFETCDEYVYEKYYDFSLFEDATRNAGMDFRKVFDVAYGPADVPSAIGTRGINGTGFLMRDGTPLGVQIRFRDDLPRTVFHAFEMIDAADWAAAIAAWEDNGRSYTVTVGGEEIQLATSRPLFQGTNGAVNVIGGFPFAPEDPSLFEDLQQRTLHAESFQFHRDMSEALAGYPDELLYLFDRLKDEMVQLIERRRGITGELLRVLGNLGDEGLGFMEVNETPFDPGIFENPVDALMAPYDDVLFQQRQTFEQFDAEVGIVVESDRIIGGATVVGESLFGGNTAGMQNRSGGGGGVIEMRDGAFSRSVSFLRDVGGTTSGSIGFPQRDGGGDIGVDDGPRPEHSDPILRIATRLLRELVAVDEEIEVVLLQAQALGCVGTPDGVLSPCDWSPRDFAEAVEDQLLVQREQDHQRCVGFTGDDFAALRIDEDVPGRFDATIDPATDVDDRPSWRDVECDDPAYNTATLRFERYTGCRDAWRWLVMRNINAKLDQLRELLGGAKDLLDPTTGQIRPGQQTSDSDGFGDSTFGAGYSYYAGWEMQIGDVENPDVFCDSRPQLDAGFAVTARIFGAEADIVDASIAAGLGAGATNRALLEVLGVSMIDVERTTEVPAAQFNVIFSEGTSDYDEYFSASATFPVGPIPVTVTAGAGGIIGAAIEARGGDSPNGNGCDEGDLAIEGAFVPSYTLVGFASAGVDALVVEAGVKIELLIVGLSFPFRTGIVFDGEVIQGAPDANVKITNDLDMVFSILGGRMAAYVEVCFILCEEWDFTIFEWAPTRLSKNLFHSSLDFAMGGLLRAQAFMPVPVVPGGT